VKIKYSKASYYPTSFKRYDELPEEFKYVLSFLNKGNWFSLLKILKI